MAGELVLITGITGFIGHATLLSAVESGYRVRGVVRKQTAVDDIKHTLPTKFLAQIELVLISDLATDGIFDEVIKEVTYIIHVASPLPNSSQSYEQDYFRPAIDITTNILSAATRFSEVRRVIVTSSVAPFFSPTEFAGGKLQKEICRSDDEIYHYNVKDQFLNSGIAYAASKSMSLDAAENFIKTQHPSFDVVFLMPSYVFGPSKIFRTAEEFSSSSNKILLDYLLGRSTAPQFTISVHIDDVAKLHVQALKPSIPAGRYLLDSGGANGTDWSEALPVVKRYFSESIGTIFPEHLEVHTMKLRLDSSKAEKTFGIEFKSFEEQVKDTIGCYLSLLSNRPE